MIFWAGIIVGAFFAWLAVRTGFYATWAMLFNVLVSIYLGIFLTPVIITSIAAIGDTAYGNALTMIAVALAAFFILHGLSYSFLTGQFSVSFPRVFDHVGGGLLGFLGGMLIWSFLVLVVAASPMSQSSFMQGIGLESSTEQTTGPYLAWWCDLVNAVVAADDNKCGTQEVIRQLLKPAKEKPPNKPAASEPKTGLNG
jgi:hypothetical protein